MDSVNIVKEIFVFILLAATVVFLLVILLYDFMPEETLAQSPEYTRDGTVAATIEELTNNNSENDTSSLLKSYTVDSSDLKSYEIKSYDKGKAYPFVDLETEQYIIENTTATQGNATVISSGTSTTPATTTGAAQSTGTSTTAATVTNTTSSTGTFFENPNSK